MGGKGEFTFLLVQTFLVKYMNRHGSAEEKKKTGIIVMVTSTQLNRKYLPH
jgi:hypothetical protein